MKKILFLFVLLILCTISANAKNVKVESLSFVNNESKTNNISAKVLYDTKLTDTITLKKDAIIDGEVIEIIEPKRGKRNGYLIIQPTSYSEGDKTTKIVNKKIRAKVKYYQEIDYKKVAIETGVDVGASFVKGGKYIAHFMEGVISPNEGETRMKSGFENLYQNSFISFIGKGKDINIKPKDELIYKFYKCK